MTKLIGSNILDDAIMESQTKVAGYMQYSERVAIERVWGWGRGGRKLKRKSA